MDTATLPNFARHMAELRKKRGLSQPMLAETCGTVANMIGRYERGEVTPSLEIARRIAAALGSSLDDLTGDHLPADPDREKAFAERCRIAAALPKADQEHILFLMDALIRDARARTAYG
jgi:transcriptional regulator with XRE-family HTH domain